MALCGNKADLYITGKTTTPMPAEPMTADADRTVFTVSNSAHRFWDPTAPVTVKLGGTIQSPSLYTVNYAGGKVKFKSAVGAGAVTVDGVWINFSRLGDSKEWSLDISADTIDTTVFGLDWKTFQTILRGASGSLSKWYIDGTFASLLDNRIGLSLTPVDGSSFDCYAYLTKDSIKAAVAGLVEESLDFQVTSELSTLGM